MSNVKTFYEDLVQRLNPAKVNVAVWDVPARKSQHLIELSSTSYSIVLYVKESNSNRRFWGLTKNHIDRLISNKTDWYAVFLSGASEKGFLLHSQQVLNRIDSDVFELSGDGDFKVNERDFSRHQRFKSLNQLIDMIL